jgi:SET domain-containing protein 6
MEGEILFSVPRSSMLSTENSSLRKELPEAAAIREPWTALMLVMFYEKGKGSASRWSKYFDVLPQSPNDFDTLIWWGPSEINELQASDVVGKIGKAIAEESFRDNLLPMLSQHRDLFGFKPLPDSDFEADILQRAHMYASIIMSYAFDVEPRVQALDEDGWATEKEEEDLPKAMIPLADMLNADAERNNSRLFYQDDMLVMKATKTVAEGEELFNDYGPLPRSDLLRRYGYMSTNYRKYDVVELPTSMFVAQSRATYAGSNQPFNAVGKVISSFYSSTVRGPVC